MFIDGRIPDHHGPLGASHVNLHRCRLVRNDSISDQLFCGDE